MAPSEWFRLNLGTRYKEFDKKWLLDNYADTKPIKLIRGFSKFALFTWHGEAVCSGDSTEITLQKTDLMVYYNQTWRFKAVPFYRHSTLLSTPSGLHTESSIVDGTYLVRPSGVVR